MRIVTSAVAGFALLAGCTDLTRTNPLDTKADVEIVVTATRKALSGYGDSVRFTATVPGYPNAPVTWSYAYSGAPIIYRPAAMVATGPTFDVVWRPNHPGIQDQYFFIVVAWVGPRYSSYLVRLNPKP